MMRRHLLAFLAVCALVIVVPAAASAAKPANGKPACSLKKKAKCKKAKLTNVKVGKQNLTGANLRGATITGGTFTGTNLAKADFSNATISNVTFKNVNLAGANLEGARLDNVTFAGAQAKSDRRRARVGYICMNAPGLVTQPLQNCHGDRVNFSHTIASNMRFISAYFTNASFAHATFSNVSFYESDLPNANFYGASWSDVGTNGFTDTMLNGAMFDASTGANVGVGPVGSEWIKGASFLGAKRTTFSRAPQAADRVRGLDGGATVLVERDQSAPAYTSISIVGTWSDSPYSFRARCGPGPKASAATGNCVRALAKGDTVTAEVRAASRVFLGGGSWTCSAAAAAPSGYSSTCTGTIVADTVLTYYGASDITPSSPVVTVKSVVQSGAATPMSKIRIEAVAGGGGRIIVQSCTLKTVCAAPVPAGTTVRVSVFREHSNGYFGMNCPGETGDPIANLRTEWPWGDDTLSGDAGDSTRYALRRICDPFEVTSDVTLTAINDAPDGAPSG